jgi:hypothetical protein
MNERELLTKLVYALEDVMCSDSDMPSHEHTMSEAQKLLDEAKEFLGL